ncbi:crossover junction endodeoxyribonuclease RuvC [Patescibacteria group bacterium]|nr:crossover junction endodeoxyribonuclease RuvC [Patescibacteria group bacterium]MBU1472717.1 crossover junction endodeoxyribonuclease RuvC [Patescibacteria group bacterium]MBU2459984.1 crossover junction endodeoxyribonuclease RuvC [Patescibacteria group bacterium]MBU2544358.1 crossover junction endodeoxyribonuclease RuvC [Patescibacteria group bacterium]
MNIFGIDPGTARVGWACITCEKTDIRVLSYGCITTNPPDTQEKRLWLIYHTILELLKRFKPAIVSVEDLFFATNATTAIAVGQSRGVILLAASESGLPVVSYTPLAVKRTITGSGTAQKVQMQRMVARILKLKEIPKPDDAADALAIALTHAYSYKMKEKVL